MSWMASCLWQERSMNQLPLQLQNRPCLQRGSNLLIKGPWTNHCVCRKSCTVYRERERGREKKGYFENLQIFLPVSLWPFCIWQRCQYSIGANQVAAPRSQRCTSKYSHVVECECEVVEVTQSCQTHCRQEACISVVMVLPLVVSCADLGQVNVLFRSFSEHKTTLLLKMWSEIPGTMEGAELFKTSACFPTVFPFNNFKNYGLFESVLDRTMWTFCRHQTSASLWWPQVWPKSSAQANHGT